MSFTLAFIPARGGSKGIPRKNLVLINNKPLITYTLELCHKISIQAALVSTEDEEIANVCAKCGFKSDYRRPANLAKDQSPTIDAVIHGVEWYQKNKKVRVDNVLLLQPTSPLRQIADVESSLKIAETAQCTKTRASKATELTQFLLRES